ncbi:TonB-dependent receptor [Foetidibacter luteolus]|uniref:TonB-dependent receptor n=1 Tax=Foetidibacter luteolus TaxID=2608880 RepID=UPI00129A31B1|nr:TonB-dependent receptor [Foetidibacter luteolus]
MRLVKLLLPVVCLLLFLGASAQKFTVTGKVTDASTGAGVEGASIKVQSTKTGTLTGKDGTYTIQAERNDVLEISYVGFATQTVNVNGQPVINISLQPSITELGQVVLIGTRRAGRIKTETPVPVDVVNVSQAALPTGRMDVTSILNYAAPSFNYNKQSGSDGADHIDLATLRGLGPDQTLVLINGKRRHQTAFVAVFGTRGRGNSGTDLSAIPVSAIDRIEILRDGASAQYGSDAMAGVINIILKKDVQKFSANIGYSGYLDNKYNTYKVRTSGEYRNNGKIDGNAVNVGLNYGLPIGNGGYVNFAGQLIANGKTFRQELNNNLDDKNSLPVNYVRRANGDGSLINGGGTFNMEIPFSGSKTSFYAFGGYNFKKSDAFAFTRDFSGRPERFPTTGIDDDVALINVPEIMYKTPDGDTHFDPHIQTRIKDLSISAGVKGKMAGDWQWDFSNTLGRNDFHYYGDKTFNASLGANKTHFDDGGFNFLQNTANLNFSKEIPGIAAGFNLAFGAEYRYEKYTIYRGEEASYKTYTPNYLFRDSTRDENGNPVFDDNGDALFDSTFKAGGSQGYPGYQPGDEVSANRNVVGAYIDAEIDVTKKLLLDAAIRIENYSDFGFTSNYKLAARFKATSIFNVRWSVSTGFRAPSLAQINFSNTFTTVQGGNIAEVKIAPNYSPITKSAGIDELKQEKSLNASLGFSLQPAKGLTITLDGYWVKVKDRVVLSGQFSADDPTLDPVFTSTLKGLNVSLAQFFANAVNTTNKGVDIVIDYNRQFAGKQNFRALFTANFQKMTIDKVNVPSRLSATPELRSTFLSEREKNFILASAPKAKFSFNLEYGKDRFTVGTRFTYFGKIVLMGYGDGSNPANVLLPQVPTDATGAYVPDQYNYSGKLVTDVFASFKLAKSITLFAGVDNLFNVHPDLGVAPGAKGWAFNNETGGPWDAVQMGGNGMRLFSKLALNF